ncbi:transcriptional regulator XRE family [Candidatus Termititenax persephonae]|uniref:Transcriptional regulator XRE family n=1 Tax=Candidatus Termititenax persephonae TaxID=2218525 RepID=A0A388THY0_9BACT|nr:transcriptional regulator XRE family [Candidatus Termititenax persephonae]
MEKDHNHLQLVLRKSIAQKLNALMKKQGLTIENAALSMELEYSNLYYVVKGRKLPRLDTLIKIANGLSVPVEYFFKNIPSKNISLVAVKNNIFRRKIFKELDRLDQPAQTFLLSVLRLYNNRRKLAAC